ncbi:MAG TPA: sodium:proton antiporter [Crocinitomicaceae bacterium]|nr:cation:proton antiporter [Flavobacteriales bacterium]HBW85357.1 sodium:proton antiporter [Crocinitomicaceae bacterium]
MDHFVKHLISEFGLPLTNPVLVFSLLLFIILLSPIVLRRLRIPGIIGLIISGLIIGPHALGLIGYNALQSEGSIKLFSTIGLLYIMFMAGLELDLNQFKKYLNKSLTFGLLTFILPLILGYPICYYALNLDATASLLVASMFSTHTLVAYPIISKYGLSKHSSVAITVGGTILTDTAVLIILAIISSSTQGNLDGAFWIRLITSLTIFSIIMFYGIPKVARWFFSKLDSEKSSQYIFVLSVVFFAAFLAEVAGVEHIIGAFVAGLVLNRLIPHNSILMNRIDFIGNSLFIPFFLIYVGMVVDYRAFLQGTWPLVIAGVLTTFAIFSKWLAAFVTQLIFKMSSTERQVIFGLSTSHAAATLAIIMVGYNEGNGILDINIVNGTVLLILFTCMTASFVTESAGKKLLIELNESGEGELNETKLRNQHIMVSMNELKGNESLIDFSLIISDPKVINPISVVSVYPNNEKAEMMIRKSRKSLEDIVKHFSGHESKLNTIATIDYNLSSGIARVSKELVADIVVMNDNRNFNFIQRMVGDERDHLMDVCDKTIFFCQFDKSMVSYSRVVVMAPPLCELENSFAIWVERIFRLAKELNLKIELFSTIATKERFDKIGPANKIEAIIKFNEIENFEDALLKYDKNKNDLIITCLARKGAVSHSVDIDTFTSKLEKACPTHDVVFVYPALEIDPLYANYDDISATPIAAGVETIQKIGREVGSILVGKTTKKRRRK